MLEPTAPVLHAARRAEHRARLLRSGTAATLEQIAEVTGRSVDEVDAEVERLRGADELVAIELPGTLAVPLVQLDERLRPDPQVAVRTRRLVAAGLDAWAVWTWWQTPSSWLDGLVPANLVATGRLERLDRALDGFLHDGAGTAPHGRGPTAHDQEGPP